MAANASGLQLVRSTGTLSNGANHNVAISANVSYMTYTGPTAAYSVSGFTNTADGRILIVYFNIAQTLTITYNAGSTSGQRITTASAADIVLAAGNPVRCVFVYDQSVGAGVGYWVLYSVTDGVFGNTLTSAQIAGSVSDETGSGALVFGTSPTLVTPALGTPTALVGTNITGTASSLTAGNVTTNANLTGHITSVGNAAVLGSFSSSNLSTALTDKTGSGVNVFATSPALVTPDLGTPTALVGTNITGTAASLNAGTAATLTTARTINGTSFNGSANITVTADASTLTGTTLNSPVVASSLTSVGTIATGTWNGTPTQTSRNIYIALGGSIKAEPVGLTLSNITNNGTLGSQSIRYVAVWLPQAATITGVTFLVTTAFVGTANNYTGVGMYTHSAGTLTLVASSTNDANLYTSTGLIQKAFSSTYAAAAGMYFIGALYCSSSQTTAPVLGGGTTILSTAAAAGDFTNNGKFAGSLASQTALPTPQAIINIVATTSNYYFALY